MKGGIPRPHAEEAPQEPSRSTRASSRRRMKVSSSFETRPPVAPQDEETFIRSPCPDPSRLLLASRAAWKYVIAATASREGL
ncbi:MAG: hypothetical protein C3F11_08215 [Methylocystaceae bacterium]|nr:MAG: hypothetical protein C3F11_08215 [Methylocystaceae bacterium]